MNITNINVPDLSERILERLLKESWFEDIYYNHYDDNDSEFIEMINEISCEWLEDNDTIEEIIEMECLNDSSL